jgi:dTDP-4-dehydrorhamnose reductase
MTILVVGSSGQVANCLAQRALECSLPELIRKGRPEIDIGKPAAAIAAIKASKPRIIVNAAAYTDVERAEDEPEQALAINGAGAGAVATAARQLGVPLIHISTDYVFSGEKAGAYTETDSVGPINAYGRSKLAGEQAVAAEHDNAIILRTSWVYSPFGKNFLTTMIRLIQSRDELSVVDDQMGCPTSAWDIADAILDLCEAKLGGSPASGIYHLTGAGVTSWHGFASAIKELSAAPERQHVQILPIDSASYPSKARRPGNSVLQTDKISAEFGIRLPEWRQSLAACLHRMNAARET